MRVPFRVKVAVGATFVCAAYGVGITSLQLHANEREQLAEAREAVATAARLGAQLLDPKDLSWLAQQAVARPDEALVSKIEHGVHYKRIYDQLVAIRNADGELFHFVYVIAPAPRDPLHTGVYLVDADVLASPPPPKAERSDFGNEYALAQAPQLRTALLWCVEQVENEYVDDPTYHERSLSAYVPVGPAADRCVGVLGVDMTERQVAALIAKSRTKIWLEDFITTALAALLINIVLWIVARRLSRVAEELRFAVGGHGGTTGARRLSMKGMQRDLNALIHRTKTLPDETFEGLSGRTSEATTSERLDLDLVPDSRNRLPSSKADMLRVIGLAVIVVINVDLGTNDDAAISLMWNGLPELYAQFRDEAVERGWYAAGTTHRSFVSVIQVDAIDKRSFDDNVLAFVRELYRIANALAKQSGEPLLFSMGAAHGPIRIRTTATNDQLVDLWGHAVHVAREVQRRAPSGHLCLTEELASMAEYPVAVKL